METRQLGWTGVKLPAIGQGTWQMERDDRQECLRAIRRGLDLGLTHIDTAELYGSGQVEELVGEAIAGRREEVFLVSKVLPHNASRQGTIDACERSLERLGTDRLDLYLLHWPGEHPLEDTFAAFEELERDGKIRFFGVSNFDEEELDEAVQIVGEGRIACNQVLYHLGERAIEHAVLPYCRDHDIGLVAYSPFGSGDFPSPRSAGGKLLAEVAAKHSASERQVALRFLLREPEVLAIPKAGKVQHIEDNAAAGDLRLDEEDLRKLEKTFPRGRRKRGVPVI